MRLIALAAGCVVALFTGAVLAAGTGAGAPLPVAMAVTGLASLALLLALARKLLRPLQHSQQTLAHRSRTVDRLLEFSQTIHGAGSPDHVFSALAHFLQDELRLSHLLILGHDPDSLPAVQMKAAYPPPLLPTAQALADIDSMLCPCLRQGQPRQFRRESPVRCAIDGALSLPPDHPAYCVPFHVGRKVQVLVHMLLPAGMAWTEELRQLAQTYVNHGHSALTSLHLLAEAERQSMTDGLTGLYNRRSLDQLLQREVALAERHGHALSVVAVDLDGLKQINDNFGHVAGDHILRAFADCVRITLRRTDLAFRYGGDEFVIALPQTPIAQAQQVVQKLRQAFAAVDFSDAITRLELQPTLSIGVAERSKALNLITLQNLLSAADQALYDAKRASRNCVRVYSPPQAA